MPRLWRWSLNSISNLPSHPSTQIKNDPLPDFWTRHTKQIKNRETEVNPDASPRWLRTTAPTVDQKSARLHGLIKKQGRPLFRRSLIESGGCESPISNSSRTYPLCRQALLV